MSVLIASHWQNREIHQEGQAAICPQEKRVSVGCLNVCRGHNYSAHTPAALPPPSHQAQALSCTSTSQRPQQRLIHKYISCYQEPNASKEKVLGFCLQQQLRDNSKLTEFIFLIIFFDRIHQPAQECCSMFWSGGEIYNRTKYLMQFCLIIKKWEKIKTKQIN